jgi:hypothetical protein
MKREKESQAVKAENNQDMNVKIVVVKKGYRSLSVYLRIFLRNQVLRILDLRRERQDL